MRDSPNHPVERAGDTVCSWPERYFLRVACRSLEAFPASVGLAHRAVQVEDQLVQEEGLASAINPRPRHVHQGLSLRFFRVVRISVSNRLTCLPAGRSHSSMRPASLSPGATGGLSARARNHCAYRDTGRQAASGTPCGVDAQTLGFAAHLVRTAEPTRIVMLSATIIASPTFRGFVDLVGIGFAIRYGRSSN